MNEHEFRAFIGRLGLSPNDAEDGWKAAVWLFAELSKAKSPKKGTPGVKALSTDIVDDIVLMAGMNKAREHAHANSRRFNRTATIRALKQHNGWKESERTLRRRWYLLDTPESDEHKRAVAMLARLLSDARK